MQTEQWLGKRSCRSISRRSSWISPAFFPRDLQQDTLALRARGRVRGKLAQGQIVHQAVVPGLAPPSTQAGPLTSNIRPNFPQWGSNHVTSLVSLATARTTTVSSCAGEARLGSAVEDVDTKMKLFDQIVQDFRLLADRLAQGDFRSGRMMARTIPGTPPPLPTSRIASCCSSCSATASCRPRCA